MVGLAISTVKGTASLLIPRMPLLGADYSRADILRDALAGLIVAAVLIPQSMAYALLAGLPPVHGLYAALLGAVAGSLWSSSRHLATGPIAIVSLLTLTSVSPLAPPGSLEFIALVSALALLVGIIQIGMGLARLGFLVRLVPLSVLNGFTSGAAVIIIITQVPHLFGFSASQGDFALQQIANIALNLFDTHVLTLAIGALSLLFLLFSKVIFPRFPATLTILASGIVASFWFSLEGLGVRIAGEIPSALPVTNIPLLSPDVLLALGWKALVIALVGFMSSYAVVKELSGKTSEKVNADQELIGQGFANLFAGLFRGLPVGGSISRTAVNYEAGAATAWSGVFASGFVVLAILVLSPYLAYLPNTILAALVIAAVAPLINLKGLRRIYAIAKTDGVIALVTFTAVFILRPDEAVLVGVLLALVLYMRKVMWVHVKEVGIHPRYHALTLLSVAPEATVFPKVLMLRIDAPIFYANIERLAFEVTERIREREVGGEKRVEVLVLDCSGVNHADVTGIEGFTELITDLRSRGIKVYLISARRDVRDILERGRLSEHVRFLHGIRELEALGETLEKGDSRMLVI